MRHSELPAFEEIEPSEPASDIIVTKRKVLESYKRQVAIERRNPSYESSYSENRE